MDAAALLGLVARVTVVLCVAGVAAYALRRSSAALRHAVWTAGLAASLLLPAASEILPAARIPSQGRLWSVVGGWMNRVAAPPAVPAAGRIPRHASPVDEPRFLGETASESMPMQLPDAGAILFAVWAVGAALCLVRLGAGLVAAHRIARRARRVEEPELSAIVRALAAEGLAPRSVRLRESAEVSAPAVAGWLRPVVLLPRDRSAWSASETRAVLVHELGHVARRDGLTQLVASIATSIYWFHPLAWYAAARMRVERERACDDRVLLCGAAPSGYATLLLDVLRASRPPALAPGMLAMARPGELETRIRSILDPAVRRRGLSARARLAMPLASAAIAGLIAAVRVDAAPAPAPAPASASLIARADTGRGEPDRRGDAMASPTSERIPLPVSALADAERAGRAALAGPDAALARVLLDGLEHAPTWPGDLVRERAAWALTRAEGARLVDPLLGALESPDWRESAYAAWALAQSRETRAVPRLIELLRRPEWRLRAAASAALDEIADPRAAPAMARAAGDEAWQVRVSAVAYLGRIDGDANRALVRDHLNDRHVAVRLAAEQALRGDR